MNFRPYIFRTAKAAKIHNSFKKSSIEFINSMLIDIFKRFKHELNGLVENSKGKRVKIITYEAAVRLILPRRISKICQRRS